MPIIHIVLFEFNPTSSHAQIEEICKHMLSLPSKCMHPTTSQPYVKSHSGGRDTSPEGLQGAFTHAFISEFDNEDDRKYYLESDPVHLDFVAKLKEVVMNVRVVDFEPGKL